MYPLTLLLWLLPLAYSSELPSSELPIEVLKGDLPMYLGDVFFPPAMNFLAWIPSADNDPQEWCSRGADASDDAEFFLHGMDGLKIHDYFKEQAYVTWGGSRFLDCVITPDNVRLPSCKGVSERNGQGGWRFYGAAFKKWTCYVVRDEERARESVIMSEGSVETMSVRGSEEKLKDQQVEPTGVFLGSSIEDAFAAMVTPM